MKFDAVLIAGPTASGKSDAALALAEHVGGEIVNADSMQVYDEVPILTAQPSMAAQTRVPHFLYGGVPVREVYSVGRYAQDVFPVVHHVRDGGRIPILVGGTGLYFSALTDGLADIPATPADVRAAARALLDEIGVERLHTRLMQVDPLTASRLRPSDPQRTLRAWEVFQATGRPLAQWQNAPAAPVLNGLRLARIVIDPPREHLRAAIAARFEAMVTAGGLEEARALEGLDPVLPAAKLLGLRELQALARGEMTQDAALLGAITATRQFAKRQMTWFRNRMAHYSWLNPLQSNIIAFYDDLGA